MEYWQQHEKSKATFRGDWCVSADKFRVDEKGYFYFCGRGDDMLKVGGKWLSPVEVENALLSHAAVLEAAVIGFKDADGLDKPKAFIVVKDGIAKTDADGWTASGWTPWRHRRGGFFQSGWEYGNPESSELFTKNVGQARPCSRPNWWREFGRVLAVNRAQRAPMRPKRGPSAGASVTVLVGDRWGTSRQVLGS